MKAFYLSLLFLCISLIAFTQSANRLAIHVEGGVKYNFKYDDYSGSYNDYDENRGFSGAQFFISGLYSLNNNLSAGVGAGVNIYTRYVTYFDGITSVPIYANVLYKLPTSGDFIPFIDLKLGYGIVSRSYVTSPPGGIAPFQEEDFNVKNSGGIYASPSVGLLFPLNNTAISLSLTYDLQVMKAKLTQLSGEMISNQTMTHSNTIGLRVGYIF